MSTNELWWLNNSSHRSTATNNSAMQLPNRRSIRFPSGECSPESTHQTLQYLLNQRDLHHYVTVTNNVNPEVPQPQQASTLTTLSSSSSCLDEDESSAVTMNRILLINKTLELLTAVRSPPHQSLNDALLVNSITILRQQKCPAVTSQATNLAATSTTRTSRSSSIPFSVSNMSNPYGSLFQSWAGRTDDSSTVDFGTLMRMTKSKPTPFPPLLPPLPAASPSWPSSASLSAKAGPSERRKYLHHLTEDMCGYTPAQSLEVLKILGTNRRTKADPFVDASKLRIGPVDDGGCGETDGGENHIVVPAHSTISSIMCFPELLYQLLDMADRQNLDDIVSWLPHRRAFRINHKERFVTELLPKYFYSKCHNNNKNETNPPRRWSSFLRQLNLYGFSRVAKGSDYGAYFHELFIGGRPDLCRYMKRVGTPTKGLDRRCRTAKAEGDEDDPDFYAMPAIIIVDPDRPVIPGISNSCC